MPARRKLMQMLTVVVHGLDNFESLVPALHALRRRRAADGVRASHFDTVAAALLSRLETSLGARVTELVRQAMVAAYGTREFGAAAGRGCQAVAFLSLIRATGCSQTKLTFGEAYPSVTD